MVFDLDEDKQRDGNEESASNGELSTTSYSDVSVERGREDVWGRWRGSQIDIIGEYPRKSGCVLEIGASMTRNGDERDSSGDGRYRGVGGASGRD